MKQSHARDDIPTFLSRIIIMSALHHGYIFWKSKYMSVSRSASDLRNVWNWSWARWTRVHPFLWTQSGGIYWLLRFRRRSRLSHFLHELWHRIHLSNQYVIVLISKLENCDLSVFISCAVNIKEEKNMTNEMDQTKERNMNFYCRRFQCAPTEETRKWSIICVNWEKLKQICTLQAKPRNTTAATTAKKTIQIFLFYHKVYLWHHLFYLVCVYSSFHSTLCSFVWTMKDGKKVK